MDSVYETQLCWILFQFFFFFLLWAKEDNSTYVKSVLQLNPEYFK